MRFLFYCSSQTSYGYQMSELHADGTLVPYGASGAVRAFFHRGGVRWALFQEEEWQILLLKKITQSGREAGPVDSSGAHIPLNVAFCARADESDVLRALTLYFLTYPDRFAYALFAAYHPCAPGAIGYRFDATRLDALVDSARHVCAPTLKAHDPLPMERYRAIDVRTAQEMLRTYRLSAETDAQHVFFAATEMRRAEYRTSLDMEHPAWYVVTDDEQARFDINNAPVVMNTPSFYDRMAQFFSHLRRRWGRKIARIRLKKPEK